MLTRIPTLLFLFLTALSVAAAGQDCAPPGGGAFEYLVGTWREAGSGGKIRIERALDGCGYIETWQLEDLNAILIRTYDSGSKRWHLSFAANDLVPQIWEGRREDGQWYFFRDWTLNGERRRSKTFWRKLSDDRFERSVEQSADGGKTWSPHVRAVYTREGKAEKRVQINSDGWRLIGDLVVPDGTGKMPAVLMLNKANGTRQVYAELASELAKKGIASLRLDLRAHGESDNLGKFGPPFDERMRAMLVGSDNDVAAAIRFLKAIPEIDPARIGVVGASYSGEQMALAARKGKYEKAYVALSPGSFSDESIGDIDRTGVPWFFVRSIDEIALMKDVFAAVRKGSKTARTMAVSGNAHGSELLRDHPELNEMIAVWFKSKL